MPKWVIQKFLNILYCGYKKVKKNFFVYNKSILEKVLKTLVNCYNIMNMLHLLKIADNTKTS